MNCRLHCYIKPSPALEYHRFHVVMHDCSGDVFECMYDSFLQAATGNVSIGAQVWVEDPTLAWAEAEVLEINDKIVKVRTTKDNEVFSNLWHYSQWVKIYLWEIISSSSYFSIFFKIASWILLRCS